MRILILGGDGYLGWPTAMRFSGRGHEVFIVDNFSRRRWHHEHSTDSLTPIASLGERIEAWREVTGRNIQAMIGNIDDGEFLDQVVADVLPEAVVHYGEQPSAPYSMISRRHAVNTQQTNVIGTLNLLFSLRDRVPDCHPVKLGTMGEYGTPNIDIEEGFIEIEHKGRKDTLPYPKLPGSIYHLSKVHDSHNIHFACRVWGLRATDLNQGVVYGIETDETALDELEEHYYNAANTKLRDLGLKPHYLGEELVRSMLSTIDRYKDRVATRAIAPKTQWKPGELDAP